LIGRKGVLIIFVILILTPVLQGMPLNEGSHLDRYGRNSQQPVTPSSSVDFNLTVSPLSISVYRGTSVTSTVEVSSLGGFSGTVSLNTITKSLLTTGISSSVSPNSLDVSSIRYAMSILNISAAPSAGSAYYNVTVLAYSGSLMHNETVSVSIPWFAIDAYGINYVEIGPGSSANVPVQISSVLGFTGVVYFTANSYRSGIDVSISPSAVELADGRVNETVVKLSVPYWLYSSNEGIYEVELNATGHDVSNVFTILVGIPPPGLGFYIPYLILTAIALAAVVALLYKIGKKHHNSLPIQAQDKSTLPEER
jgi:hypothetical protein